MRNRVILMIALFLLYVIRVAEASGFVPYIFNLQNPSTCGSGIFYLDVGHRYFDVNRHTTNVSLALTYGIFEPLDITAAYSFKNKDMLGAVKLNIFNDYTESDILSLSLYGGGGYKDANYVNNSFSISVADDNGTESVTTLSDKDRPSGFMQIIIQKNVFRNRFSLGVVPSYAYNTNFYQVDSKYDYSAGVGLMSGLFITDRIAVCGELIMNVYGFAFKYMNYNAGLKYAGYRHTFSIWISNSNGYSPVEYMTGSEELTPKISASFTREFN